MSTAVNRVEVHIVGVDESGGKVLTNLGNQAQATERKVVGLSGAAKNYRSAISAAGALTQQFSGALGVAGGRVGSFATTLAGAAATGNLLGVAVGAGAGILTAFIANLDKAGKAAEESAKIATDANKDEKQSWDDKTSAVQDYVDKVRHAGNVATGEAIDAAKREIDANAGRLEVLKSRDYEYFREIGILKSKAKTEDDRRRVDSLQADRIANQAAIRQAESMQESMSRRLNKARREATSRAVAEAIQGQIEEQEEADKVRSDAAEKRRREEEAHAKGIEQEIMLQVGMSEKQRDLRRKETDEQLRERKEASRKLGQETLKEFKATEREKQQVEDAGRHLGLAYVGSFFDAIGKAKQGDSEGAMKSFLSGLLSLGGGLIGLGIGGPFGAALGAQVGGGLGGLFHTGGNVPVADTGLYARRKGSIVVAGGEGVLDPGVTAAIGGAAAIDDANRTKGASLMGGGTAIHMGGIHVTVQGGASSSVIAQLKRELVTANDSLALNLRRILQDRSGLNLARS